MKAALPLCLLLAGCAHWDARTPTEQLRAQAAKLDIGMPSDVVLKELGVPTLKTAEVCGEAVGAPWKCTIWEYRRFRDVLRVYMQAWPEAATGLAVNRWSYDEELESPRIPIIQVSIAVHQQ